MGDIEKVLDDEAGELYKLLQGIDTEYGKNRYTESLQEAKDKQDNIRALLVETTYQLSLCLLNKSIRDNKHLEQTTFQDILNIQEKLQKLSGKKHTLLVRFRGFPNAPGLEEKNDYEIVYGNIKVDSAIAAEIVKHKGHEYPDLEDQINRTFMGLSYNSIYSIYIRFPDKTPEMQEQFSVSLRALSSFQISAEKKGNVSFENDKGQMVSYPLIKNETNSPDENLTLLGITNKIKPDRLNTVIKKIIEKNLLDRYMSIFNTFFSFQKLRGNLKRPPVEINNVLWLMLDKEKEAFTKEKKDVAQFAIKSVGGSPIKAAKILKSVYGNDYEKIDSKGLSSRLKVSSDFLSTVEKEPKSGAMKKEIVENIEKRLGEVREKVFDDLFSQDRDAGSGTNGSSGILGRIQGKVLNIVTFYKSRIDTKKKMREIVNQSSALNLQDFETISKDFSISVEDAQNLVKMLESCFDEDGRFIKGAFKKIIPEFRRFERKIFDFLWHYLREYVHEEDRMAFLNSLQFLISKMNKSIGAIKVLLADFYQPNDSLSYSDPKALMLCSLLICRYESDLADIENTPEDVIGITDKQDDTVMNYALWRLDKDQNEIFDKIKTMHLTLIESLNASKKNRPPLPADFLLKLEREAYIFFSLTGGLTARSVLRSAFKEYVDPTSMLYTGKDIQNHLNLLFQNLRVVIRGLGRIGDLEAVNVLQEFTQNEIGLGAIGKSDGFDILLKRIRTCVEEAIQSIHQRKKSR